jgi:hypothetical protein
VADKVKQFLLYSKVQQSPFWQTFAQVISYSCDVGMMNINYFHKTLILTSFCGLDIAGAWIMMQAGMCDEKLI